MNLEEILNTGAEQFGLHLSKGQVEHFFVYLSELRKWNRKINLTAISEDRDIVIKHFLDSLSLAAAFAPGEGMSLFDMGSGAGFPALPLKIIFPGLSVTLVESVKKKASFLRHIVRTLKLEGVEVVDRRTEELSKSYHGRFDVVTARAFGDVEKTLAAGTPFLRTGGIMVLTRGPAEDKGEEIVLKQGFSLDQKMMITLPHSNFKRAVWVVRKGSGVP